MKQPSTSLVLTLSYKRLNEWGLQVGDRVPVTCGTLQGVARIGQTDAEEAGNSLRWPGGWLDLRPGGLTAGLVYNKKEGLRIGPVMGIMVNKLWDPPKVCGSQTDKIREFVKRAREMNVLCYVFAASEVNWGLNMVQGYTLVGARGRETWKLFQMPLPDVVYNRVPYRKAERDDDVMRCKSRLANLKIPLFNERFLNKREMYNWLMADPRSADLIPATAPMDSPQGVERFCHQHDLVFLKPVSGSLGMGIYRATREGNRWHVRYKTKGEHTSRQFEYPRDLYQQIKRVYPNYVYVMQQGIRLKRYEGNVCDFRVHPHKNGQGLWEAAGIGAKVAGNGAVTTHVHNGGRVLAGDQVLRDWYGEGAEEMRRKLVDSSIRAAEVIEGLLKGPVGELGIDAGIDESGRVWIFETNAKPGRAIFKHPELRQAGVRSAQLIAEYAGFLARFPVTGGD